jgi:hypothetical protein
MSTILNSRYSDSLRAGRSGKRIPVGVRFSAPVHTSPEAHPASCTMRTGSFPGLKSGRGVTLTPHRLLVPWSWKSRTIPLLPLWAVRPVQSLSACTRVHFTPPTKSSILCRHVILFFLLHAVIFSISLKFDLGWEIKELVTRGGGNLLTSSIFVGSCSKVFYS